jgi:hypothetical protein
VFSNEFDHDLLEKMNLDVGRGQAFTNSEEQGMPRNNDHIMITRSYHNVHARSWVETVLSFRGYAYSLCRGVDKPYLRENQHYLLQRLRLLTRFWATTTPRCGFYLSYGFREAHFEI